MLNLSFLDWFLAILGAMGIGLSKGAFPGLSMLTIGLYAHIFEPFQSIGIVLIIVFLANVVAVIIFRKFADWRIIRWLLPFTLVGVLLGYLFLLFFPIAHVHRVIGIILMLMIGTHFFRHYKNLNIGFNHEPSTGKIEITKNYGFSCWTILTGLICGFSTMVANAAAPIAMIYLMSIGLDKFRFIATMAWLFFILNVIKIPFHITLGSINNDFFKISLILGLIATITVFISPYLIKYIPQKIFNAFTWALVLIASINLSFG